MKTTFKILLGLIFATLGACSTLSTLDQTDNNESQKVNVKTHVSKLNDRFIVDTTTILTNQNLNVLLNDLENNELKEQNKITEIPSFIKVFLDGLTDDNFSIANPGENWQVSDAVLGKLPARQLIYLGLSDNIMLLTYYSGGIGKSEHILIFKYNNKQLLDFWCGNVQTDLTTKNEIVNFLKANKDKEWGLNTNILIL